MELRAELVHAEAGVRIVQVSAWQKERCLGSTLAEAATAEEAEQAAINRLRQRLGEPPARPELEPPAPAPPHQGEIAMPPPKPTLAAEPPPPPAPPTATTTATATAAPAAPAPQESAPATPAPSAEPAPTPDDWSEELARIDVRLRQLNWTRDQEATYLSRAFGHPSRSRLTSYGDLLAYLRALEAAPGGSDPAALPVPLRRADLLSQCDQLLAQLGWDATRGRQLLETEFRLSSRQQLSDEQLLRFNMLLEEEVVQLATAES